MEPAPITVSRHESDQITWTMARRPAPALLAGLVAGYCGYAERSREPLRRREVATGNVALIISFGDPIAVEMSASATRGGSYTSFIAGLHEGFAVTEHQGRQRGLQVDLTPLGAYRLLAIPQCELANEVVPLAALGDTRLAGLADRLASAPDWPARFALMDSVLLGWAAAGPHPDRAVAWAWSQLERAHGQVPVGVLASEIGWSRRHFVARFRRQVGLPPKPTGRVLRFRRAAGLLRAGDARSISAVAAACGYADHSHLVREFHDLAGCSPSALVGAQLPDGGGTAG